MTDAEIEARVRAAVAAERARCRAAVQSLLDDSAGADPWETLEALEDAIRAIDGGDDVQ